MFDFEALKRHSPILLRGDEYACCRDPTVYYRDGVFHLFCSYCTTEFRDDGFTRYVQIGMTRSRDLMHFEPIRALTPKDVSLNYSSPGNIVFWQGKYRMCCQTYCCENGERTGNSRSKIWLTSSDDLEHWDEPRLLRVKGDDVPVEEMGRMIDAFLIQNPEGEWLCFYKQNGVSFSKSKDLEHWTFLGHAESGENVCVIRDGDLYRLWDSPRNGIGEKVSRDLIHWEDTGRLHVFGQREWPWAQGRISAGYVLDLRKDPDFRKALMFFHGTGPYDEKIIFNQYACISVAWSDDLVHWDYPRGDFGQWKVDLDHCTGF